MDISAVQLDKDIAPRGEPHRRRPDVLVAIPALNEQKTVSQVISRCLEVCEKVVVVDDGSSDQTASLARVAGAIVLQHSRNLGKGAAIRTAIDYALCGSFRVIVFLDGDMQHDPFEIPALLKPLDDGTAEVSLGVRSGAVPSMPLYRRLGAKLLDYGTALAGGGRLFITDSQCGFRALLLEVASSLDLKSNGMGVEAEMLVELGLLGVRVSEVPVHVRYDVDGSTYDPLQQWLDVAGTILRTRFSQATRLQNHPRSLASKRLSPSSEGEGR